MIKKIIRLNVTNKCNMSCITCPISANPSKNGYMKFSDFQNILCEYKNVPLELVLEGGEPFLHPHFNLFVEYASTIREVKKIIISTNGTLIDKDYQSFLNLIDRIPTCVQLNIAITKYLIDNHKHHMEMCKSLLNESKFHISFDVTYTSEEEKKELVGIITKYNIPLELCSFSIVKAYGALKDTDYPKICDCNNQWHCYATDGTYFGNDVEKRAAYELSLCYEEQPIFDIVNHRQMWLLTHGFIADISFENQDNCKQSVKDFQWHYCKQHNEKCYHHSYVFSFMNKHMIEDNDIFQDLNVYSKENEVISGLCYLMETTSNMKRFYLYKDMAMKLCLEIAHAKVKENIKTTDDCIIQCSVCN